MAAQKRILVLVRTQLAYGREVTRGIARFARGRPDWRLFSLVPHDDVPSKDRLGDAAIGHNPEMALGDLLRPGAPRVYTGYAKAGEEAGAARVRSDDEAIGRLGGATPDRPWPAEPGLRRQLRALRRLRAGRARGRPADF